MTQTYRLITSLLMGALAAPVWADDAVDKFCRDLAGDNAARFAECVGARAGTMNRPAPLSLGEELVLNNDIASGRLTEAADKLKARRLDDELRVLRGCASTYADAESVARCFRNGLSRLANQRAVR